MATWTVVNTLGAATALSSCLPCFLACMPVSRLFPPPAWRCDSHQDSVKHTRHAFDAFIPATRLFNQDASRVKVAQPDPNKRDERYGLVHELWPRNDENGEYN